jgi:hypothetical protein
MATATYDLIASQTLASAAASITFSSIAASWTDLRLVLVGKNVTGNSSLLIRFNGDTSGSTLYSSTKLIGTGTAASSSASTSTNNWNTFYFGLPNTANTFGFASIDIFSYTGSTYKTGLITCSNDANGSGDVDRVVGLYSSTSAITSITLSNQSTYTFDVGTTAYLYGIKAA